MQHSDMESLPAPVRKFGPFLAVAALLIVAYLGYGKLTGGSHSTEEEAHAGAEPSALDLEAAADDKQDRREERVAGPLVDLGEPLVVNLGDPGGHTTVRVGVALQVDEGTPVAPAPEGETAPVLVERAIARDVVIATLGGLTSANLLKPAAREGVRDLLVRRLNRGLPATLVLRAYFTELTVDGANPAATPVDLAEVVAAAARAEEAADEAKADAEQAEAEAEDAAAEKAAEEEASAEDEQAADDAAHAGDATSGEAASEEKAGSEEDASPEAQARSAAAEQVEEEHAATAESDGADAHADDAQSEEGH
jgi:flagellar basal body-associated protein FliL